MIRLILGIIVILFLMFTFGLGSMVYQGVGTVEQGAAVVKEQGLKGLVDKVWCGEKGCENDKR